MCSCSIVQVQVCKHISWSSRPRFGHYQRGRPSLLLPRIIVIAIIIIHLLMLNIIREGLEKKVLFGEGENKRKKKIEHATFLVTPSPTLRNNFVLVFLVVIH